MHKLTVQPTVTAEWYTLILEAEAKCEQELGEDIESYLVFLLERFTEKPEIVQSVLALEFLEGSQQLGHSGHEQLQEVGDKCLIFSGLFPGRAERRQLGISYFVELGQSAYGQLYNVSPQSDAEIFALLSENFVSMMDVLQATRGEQALDQQGLQNIELWQQTGSKAAYQRLQSLTDGFIIAEQNQNDHKPN